MEEKVIEKPVADELPEEWWYKVYFAVIVTTVIVISLLWTFSRFFS